MSDLISTWKPTTSPDSFPEIEDPIKCLDFHSYYVDKNKFGYLKDNHITCPDCGSEDYKIFNKECPVFLSPDCSVLRIIYSSFRCNICPGEWSIQEFDLEGNLVKGKWRFYQIDPEFPPKNVDLLVK